MIDLLTLLAQLPTIDPLATNSGWLREGLLGCVLSWIMFVHLPAKDKIVKELSSETNAAIRAVTLENSASLSDSRNSFSAALDTLTRTFREETKAERMSCESHFNKLADAMTRNSETAMKAFQVLADRITSHAEYNRQHNQQLHDELESLKAKQQQGK